MTVDLVQFLRARLDEDEQIARGADSSVWPSREVQIELDDPLHHVWRGTELSPTMARQIVRHCPARVLAEVDAKRRMLTAHKRDTTYSFSGCITCDAGDNSCGCMGGSAYEYPCETLRLLALPYASHPDYRSEWAP